MSDNDTDWAYYASGKGGQPVGIHKQPPEVELTDEPSKAADHGYVVEEDIPIPPRRQSTPLRIALHNLEPGQSFKFFGQSELMLCRNAISSERRLMKTREYIVRQVEQTREDAFYRVWRIK